MLQDALRELQGSIQFEVVELANSAPEIHEINVQNVAQEEDTDEGEKDEGPKEIADKISKWLE